MKLSRHRTRLFVVASVLVVSACSSSTASQRTESALADDAVTIGSFDFPESAVLAEVYGQALTAAGFHVQFKPSLGPRELVLPALRQGLVELVPEYAGTALQFLSLGAEQPSADVGITHAALVRALADDHVVAAAPAPAQDANAIVVTARTAARYHLATISDLAVVAPQLTFGGPPECPNRPFCLQGLNGTYGLAFRAFVPLDAGGPVSVQALVSGEVDVVLLFTTDPRIAVDGLVELVDDRHLQPAENVTPVLRKEVIDRWGADVLRLIDRLSSRLTTDDLRAMTGQLRNGTQPAAVAAAWLASHGTP